MSPSTTRPAPRRPTRKPAASKPGEGLLRQLTRYRTVPALPRAELQGEIRERGACPQRCVRARRRNPTWSRSDGFLRRASSATRRDQGGPQVDCRQTGARREITSPSRWTQVTRETIRRQSAIVAGRSALVLLTADRPQGRGTRVGWDGEHRRKGAGHRARQQRNGARRRDGPRD